MQRSENTHMHTHTLTHTNNNQTNKNRRAGEKTHTLTTERGTTQRGTIKFTAPVHTLTYNIHSHVGQKKRERERKKEEQQ
jgi:hypothetical protein